MVNQDKTNLIYCEHHEIGELTNRCKSKVCIYNPKFQSNYNGVKFCNVGGTVDPNDISPDKREKLTEEQLEPRVIIEESIN